MVFFQRSNETCGEHHITFYNLGICSHYLKRYKLAVGFFDETLARCPEYVHAHNWKDKSLAAEVREDAEQELSARDGGVVSSEDTFRIGEGEAADTVTWTHHMA